MLRIIVLAFSFFVCGMADDSNGWNSLHQAVYQGSIEAVKQEIVKEDIDSTTDAGLSPLHIAVKKRDEKMLEFLLQNGAYVDAQDFQGFSPLYYAVIQNRVSLAQTLLKYEADPNLSNDRGNAPIHQIAYKNRFEMLDLFVLYGANLHLQNKYGMYAYHFAQKAGYTGMKRELQQLMQLYKKPE